VFLWEAVDFSSLLCFVFNYTQAQDPACDWPVIVSAGKGIR